MGFVMAYLVEERSCMCPSVWFFIVFFFFKQKTAYEMRISDWSSDVCSSDLPWQWMYMRANAQESAERKDGVGDLPALLVDHDRMNGAEFFRSEERRVGKACVSTCRSRWSPYL